EKNLEEAIRYLKKAADHISVEDHPSFLAETQANLACAYGHLSEINDKQTNLDNAIAYTKESLEIYTPKDYPYFHALAKSNLGTLILNKLTLEQSETNERIISEAINYILESLNMFSIKEYPLDYADYMIVLGVAYILISNYKNKQENIKNTISSYENE